MYVWSMDYDDDTLVLGTSTRSDIAFIHDLNFLVTSF